MAFVGVVVLRHYCSNNMNRGYFLMMLLLGGVMLEEARRSRLRHPGCSRPRAVPSFHPGASPHVSLVHRCFLGASIAFPLFALKRFFLF